MTQFIDAYIDKLLKWEKIYLFLFPSIKKNTDNKMRSMTECFPTPCGRSKPPMRIIVAEKWLTVCREAIKHARVPFRAPLPTISETRPSASTVKGRELLLPEFQFLPSLLRLAPCAWIWFLRLGGLNFDEFRSAIFNVTTHQ